MESFDHSLLLFASERRILEQIYKRHRFLRILNASIKQILPSQPLTLIPLQAPLGPQSTSHARAFKVIPSSKSCCISLQPTKTNHSSDEKLLSIDTSAIHALKRCTKCILPETFPFIQFDENGVCNYCRNHQRLVFTGEQHLRQQLSSKNSRVIVAISGGRDSCYGLHYIKKVLGLDPVAYTYDWGMVTDLARRNISRMCGQLGVEHILIAANIAKKREYIKKNVSAWLKSPSLGTIPLFMAGDKLYFYYANKLMKQFLLLLCSFFAVSTAHSQEIDTALFKNYTAAFVMKDLSSGAVINIDPQLSARRLAPCSTFKIYNTLIGLELGLLKDPDAPWYKWDGVKRDIEGWNHDLSLREAFRVSAVPAYQILARQIGEQRMGEYIEKIGYGTRDISAGIDSFWLVRPMATSIMISADEQVELLNKLLDGRLPFSEKNVALLKDIMKITTTEKGTLYGKTGSGPGADGKWVLGWFVGFVESGGAVYVFACNITDGEEPSGLTARGIVQNVLKAQGLL
jgi:beta-lactamase class D